MNKKHLIIVLNIIAVLFIGHFIVLEYNKTYLSIGLYITAFTVIIIPREWLK